jgi:hypothetical protein
MAEVKRAIPPLGFSDNEPDANFSEWFFATADGLYVAVYKSRNFSDDVSIRFDESH